MRILTVIQGVQRRLIWICARFKYRKQNVQAAGPLSIRGMLPAIGGNGLVQFGELCSFRCFRGRHHITVEAGAKLVVGDHCFFNDSLNLFVQKSVELGDNVKIGDSVSIYDTDFHQVSSDEAVRVAPVIIKDNVWVGAGCYILPGVIIGKNSVIAAGSVVTSCIPDNSVAAGTPAKVIKTFESPSGWLRN